MSSGFDGSSPGLQPGEIVVTGGPCYPQTTEEDRLRVSNACVSTVKGDGPSKRLVLKVLSDLRAMESRSARLAGEVDEVRAEKRALEEQLASATAELAAAKATLEATAAAEADRLERVEVALGRAQAALRRSRENQQAAVDHLGALLGPRE